MPEIDARDRLIVALDLADAAEAQRMVRDLEGVATFFKVGLALQLAPGVEELIRWLIDSGKRVFLDYKYYDIAETLKKAVSRAARTGVSFLTIHGSSNLIRGAVEGRGDSPLKLLTVTVLTSMDAGDMAEMGYVNQTVEDLVLRRTRMALAAGCDGVIASGQEAGKIRELAQGKLLIVTPGIRPDGYPSADQKRTMTPHEAIAQGADYLVIGRPITNPRDGTPRQAVQSILAEMESALGSVS